MNYNGNELVSFSNNSLQVGGSALYPIGDFPPYPSYYPIYEQHYHNWYPLYPMVTKNGLMIKNIRKNLRNTILGII